MSIRSEQRLPTRHHVEWWIVTAWGSLGLVVLAGVAAAAGVGVG